MNCKISIIVACFLLVYCSFAQKPIILTDYSDSYKLSPNIKTFEDTSGLLKIEDVIRDDFDHNFIQKPFNVKILLEKIREVLESK